MNYSELIKDASLEEIVRMNKLVDYLLEQPNRQKTDHLRAIKIAGEIAEAEKFKLMMPEHEQGAEEFLSMVDETVEFFETLERIDRTGCAYPEVLAHREYPASKFEGAEHEIQKYRCSN